MSGKARLAPKLKDRVSPRSDPQQERSRNRQQALLDAAEEVLAEVGVEGVRMREVARRAHLPIASVYHYFPSAQALIRTLVERLLDELRSVLTEGLARVAAAEDEAKAEAALIAIVDAAGDFMESRPNLPILWGAMRGSPELRALDIADAEENARLLAPALAALLPKASAGEVEALALVVVEAVSSALLLACELHAARRRMIRAMLIEFVAGAVRGLIVKYRSRTPGALLR